jgi:hypothetical protein
MEEERNTSGEEHERRRRWRMRQIAFETVRNDFSTTQKREAPLERA